MIRHDEISTTAIHRNQTSFYVVLFERHTSINFFDVIRLF